MKRAIIYTRVSIDEQAKTGYSLVTQLEACRKYAEAHGFQIIGEFQDDYSGAKLDRPGLEQVRKHVELRETDAIIVYSSDRLTRNLAHLLILREEWQRAAVELHYCNRGKSENTAESRMTENIEGVFNDYWREKIIEASRRGRIKKAANGKWVGSGNVPYGYRREGERKEARLVIYEPEAAIVRRIFDAYTGKDGSAPLPYRTIARMLQEEGVPPPNRGPAGRGWYGATVGRLILRRREYVGEFHYGGQTIILPALAIVSTPIFNAAQNRIARNKLFSARNSKTEYLLSGHVFCSCGGRMSGYTPHGTSYYRCMKRSTHPHLTTCREKSVRCVIADILIWNWLYELLSDEEKLRHGLGRKRERDAQELEPKRARLGLVCEMIEREERSLKRLAQDLKELDSDAGRSALKSEMDQVGREIASLRIEQESLTDELARIEITEEGEEEILHQCNILRSGMKDADFETKRYFFDRLGIRAQVRTENEKQWLDVNCSIPQWSGAIELPSRQKSASSQTFLARAARRFCPARTTAARVHSPPLLRL